MIARIKSGHLCRIDRGTYAEANRSRALGPSRPWHPLKGWQAWQAKAAETVERPCPNGGSRVKCSVCGSRKPLMVHHFRPGRGAVWLARLNGVQEVGGSNPLAPIRLTTSAARRRAVKGQ